MTVILVSGAVALLLGLHASFLFESPWPILVYAGPFVGLLLVGGLTRVARRSEAPLQFAAKVGLIPVVAFHVFFLYEVWVPRGGGANIGLGALYLLLPFVTALLMVAGRSVIAHPQNAINIWRN